MMYVNNSALSLGSTSFSISSGELSAAQSLVETYIVILKSRLNLEAVIEKAELPYTYEELELMITAQGVNETRNFRGYRHRFQPTGGGADREHHRGSPAAEDFRYRGGKLGPYR